MHPEILIRGGRVFDGNGGEGVEADVAIQDGAIVAIGPGLEAGPDTRVIEAAGRWVTPGFVDMHTHYDAEVEFDPSLHESVRHGVTTVLTGSCSLSMVMGEPQDLADQFCRVEAIPREVVLPLLERVKDWDSPREYIAHLKGLPLGPNVACLLGHSTIRSAVMGLGRSVEKKERPTPAEMRRMEDLLNEALDVGFVGLSISTLPWDKLDGEVYRSRPMPSVFGSWREYRRLAKHLRRRGRVLQAVPNISTKVNIFLFLLISAGLFVRKALKTTLISMMDVRADRFAFRIAGVMSRVVNRILGGDFRMQALPEPFDLYADGMDIVVFEEFEAGTAALHVTDQLARTALMRDPAYRKRFKRQWRRKLVPRAYHRDLRYAEVVRCPDASVVGKTFAALGEERGQDAIDVFLDLVIEHGRALRWYTLMGNDRPAWLRWILTHPDILIGFSDAGAHLRNMAHYNFPMRLLKRVRDAEREGAPFMSVGRAVERLSSEIARWLDVDAGVLAVGKRADVVVIDPAGLDEAVEAIHEEPVPELNGLPRLVRRNPRAVDAVLVNGRLAVEAGEPVAELGHAPGYGRVLEAGVESPGTPTLSALRV
ncbi:MAG: amidohydrolase family protein [Planctomycetes bacterium]|nr:amidohydrolase family protein [Planctomycetota bacterium]